MIWAVVAASLAVFSWKYLGYLVPEKYIKGWVRDFASRVTVVMLTGLVAVQTFAVQGGLAIDARAVSLALAAVLFALRVPYIVVVVAAAAVAAILRNFLGL